jgi:hypothetical protein
MDELALAGTKGDAAAAAAASGPFVRDDRDQWSSVAALPTPIMVAVPLPGFRIRDMLALRPGSIVASAWRGDREVPLSAGHVEFAWVEFEVTDEALSARITRLAGE